jgi:Holliday junction resolvasome RuvABC endonuclease subunit
MVCYRRMFAVDPSLVCSGWALFSVPESRLVAVGKIKAKAASYTMAERLLCIQRDVDHLFSKLQLGGDDVLVCEAPTAMQDPHNVIKVEQVRGLFEVLARQRGAEVPGRINPRSVQFEVMGLRGKQVSRTLVKDVAVRTAVALYPQELAGLGLPVDEEKLRKYQDIVDAILVGRFALLRLQEAMRGERALEDTLSSGMRQDRTSWRVRPRA